MTEIEDLQRLDVHLSTAELERNLARLKLERLRSALRDIASNAIFLGAKRIEELALNALEDDG